MFKKIFIIEDTESDIEDLIDFLKLLPIEDYQMIIVKDINRAFDIIKTNMIDSLNPFIFLSLRLIEQFYVLVLLQ